MPALTHDQWIVSMPRRAGKSWLRDQYEEAFRKEVQRAIPNTFIYGIDPAKPGSDQTAVEVLRWPPMIPVPSCPIAEAAFPKQPDTEHIWNMIVLAAESSRYG